MKRLPIGINTLQTLRDSDCLYVDKTPLIAPMVERAGRWFLSRPRRFGKSLLLDTFKSLFEGHEALFRGLAIHPDWDWQRRRSVIKLDFADGVIASREALDQRIHLMLDENRERLGLTAGSAADDIPGAFGRLIRQAHAASGERVVILIDEYDKPILDNIEQPEQAAAVREGLKNLYSVMKGQDAHIHFIFMTGVTKFSKVSLFSGLNQLDDITLDARFATLCGYTEADLDHHFAEHLAGVDRSELKRWYNGYRFLGEAVYNPYDILLFIDKGYRYRNYWFETGSPSFLVKLFRQKRWFLPDLEQLEVGDEILDSFDVERINPVTLLFQSGYLTISSERTHLNRIIYRLQLPNLEVRQALHDTLITGYTGLEEQRLPLQSALYQPLVDGDPAQLIATIRRLFASIPWRNFNNRHRLPESEGYYASVLYAFFASLNAVVIAEDITNHGQVDLTIQLAGYCWVIEIKVDPTAAATVTDESQPAMAPVTNTPQPAAESSTNNPALAQISARGYSEKYRAQPGRGIFELGLIFGGVARNLVQADWRRVV